MFQSQTEQIVYFRNGESSHINNVQLGKHGRNRTTAWHYDGMTTATSERAELLKEHATPKPTDLLQDAILDVTAHGGIVLDPLGGIGSTMVAAHAAERRGYLMEVEPRYVDVSIRRMRNTFGLEAIRLQMERNSPISKNKPKASLGRLHERQDQWAPTPVGKSRRHL